MLICALDVETTGLCPEKDRITEIGFVVWDTVKQTPVHLSNTNFLWPNMPTITEEIAELTGIDQEHLELFHTQDNRGAILNMAYYLVKYPLCVAHNAPFDKSFITKAFDLVNEVMPEILWIDTLIDIPYPQIKTRKLVHLCAEHGINPNQFSHRGLFDILKTLELLSKYDFDTVLGRAKTPNVVIKGTVCKPWNDPKPDGEKDNDIAKQNGFQWDGKRWTKSCKENEIGEMQKRLTFPIEVIS